MKMNIITTAIALLQLSHATSTPCTSRDRTIRLKQASSVLAARGRPDNTVTAMEALSSLIQNMPCMDLANTRNLSSEFLVDHTLYRLQTRHRWKTQVPWSEFLDAVLPYATLTEPRDGWDVNKELGPYMSTLVTPTMSLREAIVQLNLRAWAITSPPIVFKAAPPNKLNAYSPREVVRDKQSSCTGESVFLVAAMRSVGIPARVAGVPHWNKGPQDCPQGDASPPCGNHNWVEAFDGTSWVFVDQNAGVGQVNTAWFFPALTNQLPGHGDRQHMIYASSWSQTRTLRFHLVFDEAHEKQVPALDRTQWYHDLARKNIMAVQ